MMVSKADMSGSMLLLIDIGNTRLKWRLQSYADSAQVIERGELLTQEVTQVALQQQLPVNAAEVWFTSVAADAVNHYIRAWADGQGIPCRQAVTQERWQDLVNSYSDCSRMGVDRWLVMVAARYLTKLPVCIIDCGSASTLDYVAADGEHEGGFIIPGQRLMVQSLLQDTANIAFTEAEADLSQGYGTSTAGAVMKGARAMHRAGIQALAEQAVADGYEVFVTGGDSEFLALGQGLEYVPEMVLDGLWACLYHEPR